MSSPTTFDLDQFPTLKAIEDRVPPDILHSLYLDFQRTRTLMTEIDAERRAFKVKHERARHERDVLQTALTGLFNLGSELRLEPFLEQALEIVARLAGAEVGALSVTVTCVEDGSTSPLLVTRHCTSADLAFVREELHHPRGVLKIALEQDRIVALPEEDTPARLLEDLHQRHVRAAIAIPFGQRTATAARGILYLEHMSRSDAFSGDLSLVQDSLRFIAHWITRMELETVQRLSSDHTVRYRQEGRYARIAGRGQSIAELLARLEVLRLGGSDATVLLLGEAGTGKGTVAETVHETSHRAAGPFIRLRCDRDEDGRLSALLFGDELALAHGSTEAARGALELAKGGTLYLEDVDRLSLTLQTRLVRTLQERRFVRNHGEIPVRLDARIISSAGSDLQLEIQRGRVRPELAERLALFQITLPPLRERREDILPLAEHFLVEAGRQSARSRLTFSPQAISELERRPWPGNLDELRDAVFAAVGNTTGSVVDIVHLQEIAAPSISGIGDATFKSWKIEHDEFQRRLIRLAMELSNRNVTQAARKLKISRQYLNNRLRTLGMGDLRGAGDPAVDLEGDDVDRDGFSDGPEELEDEL